MEPVAAHLYCSGNDVLWNDSAFTSRASKKCSTPSSDGKKLGVPTITWLAQVMMVCCSKSDDASKHTTNRNYSSFDSVDERPSSIAIPFVRWGDSWFRNPPVFKGAFQCRKISHWSVFMCFLGSTMYLVLLRGMEWLLLTWNTCLTMLRTSLSSSGPIGEALKHMGGESFNSCSLCVGLLRPFRLPCTTNSGVTRISLHTMNILVFAGVGGITRSFFLCFWSNVL